jgi:hypothetical protein
VWSDLYKPTWTRLRTIIRRGGRHGKIVCTPESLSCLLRRPALIGYDAMDWLTRWGRRVLAEGPGSRSAEDRLKRRCGVQDSLSLSPAGSRSADRAK